MNTPDVCRTRYDPGMANEYWVVSLPGGQRLKGEQIIDAMNRELAELAGRGWEVVGFDRSSQLGPATFVLRKDT